MARCFVRDCEREAVHLVDFRGAGEGWLPMCGPHKRLDNTIMTYLKASPENITKFAAALDNADHKDN
jgi:hypothetical protein